MKKLIISLAALCGFFIAQNAYAVCTNYTTYSDGAVLTAASLNNLQTNYSNCVNDVLNGDTFTGNMLWYSGSDISMYSDTGSTLKASIDGTTGATIAGLTQAGQTTNCGMSVSGSTFSIHGYDGSALSGTNPCVIAVNSNTVGRVALAYFTSNVTFTFGASSDTDANLFGISSADWADPMPFFLGVIYNGTTPYFIISRLPKGRSDYIASGLCQKGDTDCDSELDAMLLTSGATLNSYLDVPITQVGWFKMTYAVSDSSWTATVNVDSTYNQYPGFNFDYEKEIWTMPAGQNGASSGKYYYDSAGTAPVFSSNYATYQILRNGICNFRFYFDGDGGTDGAAGNNLVLALPYDPYLINTAIVRIRTPTFDTFGAMELNGLSGSFPFTLFRRQTSFTAYTTLLNSDFTNGTRHVSGSVSFRPFLL